MLFCDVREGPYASGMAALLVARNVGVILWMLSFLLGHSYLLNELRTWRSSSAGGSGQTSPHETSSTKVQLIVEYFVTEQKRARVSACLVTVFYVVFCVPFMWTFQADVMVLFAVLSAPSRPARYLRKTKTLAAADAQTQVVAAMHSPAPSYTVPSTSAS